MHLIHEYNDLGTKHRLKTSAGLTGDWVGYTAIAVLAVQDSRICAVTDYYEGSEPFPNKDQPYYVTQYKELDMITVTPARKDQPAT